MICYAHGSGSATIKPGNTKESIREAVKGCYILSRDNFEYDVQKNDLEISIVHDIYHDDEVLEFLNTIAPFVSDGQIEFGGEDDGHWAFIFNPATSKWEEQNGQIVYGDRKLIDLSKVAVLSVYHSFDSEAPVYLFSSEEEAIAELKKQVEDEIRIETEEAGHVLGEDIFLTRANDYSFAQIRIITPDGEESLTEWTLGQIIDRTRKVIA